MKRSFLGALLVACGAAFALSGCNGGTFEELEKAPVAFQRDTAKPRAQVTACITDGLSTFGSDLGRFPDIEPGVSRLLLGGDESDHYRNYYQIEIDDQGGGSHVSVRSAKASDDKLSLRDLSAIVNGCL